MLGERGRSSDEIAENITRYTKDGTTEERSAMSVQHGAADVATTNEIYNVSWRHKVNALKA